MDIYQLHGHIPVEELDKCKELCDARDESNVSRGFGSEFLEITGIKNENKYAVSYPNGDLQYLSINLNASDKTLISEFENLLRNHRKEANSTNLRSRIDERDMKKWCKYKKLPYIDLVLWGYFNKISINQNF